MKRIAGAAIAALVLVAGAAVAVAIVSPIAEAQEQETDVATGDQRRGVLVEVLDRLVDDGTLTRSQADAVEQALRDEAAERKPLRRAARRGAKAGFRLARLLEDGVLDAEELGMLRPNHPLRDPDGPAAAYLDDGRLTVEELRTIRQNWKASRSVDG